VVAARRRVMACILSVGNGDTGETNGMVDYGKNDTITWICLKRYIRKGRSRKECEENDESY
jgi:hypothetical protein